MSALPNPPYPQSGHGDLEPPRRHPRWPKVLLWIGGIFLGLIVLVVVGVAVLLHSQKFHDYVLNQARTQGSQALGSQVEIQNYTLTWSGISPTLDVYGVVVHGAAPYANPPLLEVEHAKVAVRVVSLLQKKWYLGDVLVHRPVVRLYVDANGNNNLPKPKSSDKQSQSNTTIFDLGVRHALLDQGQVYYNDRKNLLDADLHDLNLQAAYNVAQNAYSGTLGYTGGNLHMGDYQPIQHNLSAAFELSPNRMTLSKATLQSGPSQVSLDAVVDNYSTAPKAAADYHATLDATDFRRILHNANVPLGVIRLDGHVDYASRPDQPNAPVLELVKLNGTLASDRLELRTPTMRGDVRAIRGRYSLENGVAQVHSLNASLLGGDLNATATVRDLTGTQKGTLKATLDRISLAQLKQLANSPSTADVTVGGSLNADANASWTGSVSKAVADANATINAAVGSTQSTNTVPLNGVIHARYNGATEQIALNQSFIRTPQTAVTLDGTVSQRSQLNVALQANDLHELENIANIFRKPAPGQQQIQPLGLFGRASFRGAVTGSTSAPHLTGQLNGNDIQVHGSQWRLLRASVDASPSQVSIQNGQLQPVGRGNITFGARAGLKQWAFTPASPFQVSLNGQQLNVADLAKAAGSTTPVTGTLNVNVQAQGTQKNPVGQGTVTLAQASVSGETIQQANINFNATGDAAHAVLNVRMPAGSTNGNVTYYPKTEGYEVALETRNFRLDQLNTVKQRNLNLTGVLNLVANGKGTLKDPQLTASLTIPQLKAQGQTVDNLSLQANVANHVADVALDSRAVNTNIRGRAKVNITGDYYAEAAIDTQSIPLQPLVATYAPDQAGLVTGQTELHATLRGPLKRKEQVEAHVLIPTLNVNYDNKIQVAAAGPIKADYTNGVLNLQRSAIRGTGTDLQFQGTVPVVDRTQPLSVLLLGTVDLRLAQLMNPDVTSNGQLKFNINSYGKSNDPNVQGQVEIVNANFSTLDAPLGMQNGNGVLTLTKDRLNVTSFSAKVGGGQVTAKGGVLYRPNIQFDLALQGEGIRLLYPDGVRSGMSMNLTMTGSTEQAFLRGQVNVDQLSFSPDFDVTSIAGAAGGGVESPPSQGFSNNLNLNINVRTTSGINLVSRTMSVAGAANLRVTGTASQPVILGRINLNSGDLLFNGNRYLLQGGTVDFINPVRTEPVVNVSINTTVQQYNIGMRFEGPIDHLRTSYSSDPALPPSDIINLIAFGKTTEASAAASTNNAAVGSLGAEQKIASAVSGQITSRVQKIAGISHLSVDPTLGANNQNPGATVTVQQRVTSKIFVTFSTDVTSTQNQVIQLEYQATPRVSVSGTRDQNGGFGFDTRIRKQW